MGVEPSVTESGSSPKRAPGRSARGRAVSLLLLCLVLLFAGLWLRELRRGLELRAAPPAAETASADLELVVQEQQRRLASYHQVEGVLQAWLELLTDRAGTQLELRGPAGIGVALLDSKGVRLGLVARGLPPPEPGKNHQAWWLDQEGVPSSLGMLPAGSSAAPRSLLVAAPERTLRGILITLEPELGSQTPGTSVALASSAVQPTLTSSADSSAAQAAE